MNNKPYKHTLKIYFSFLIGLLFFSMSIQGHAEKFDQRYLQWKAQQQAQDARLKGNDPNYYLGKPTLEPNAKQTVTMGTTSSSTAKVNVNTADLQQLQQLNGVGAKKAQAILEYRQQNGKFKNIEDLKNVKGIGPKMLEKNRAMIIL
ncbi:ComEA family DNA-binding protein [Acinetobacter defluvii]|uniref:ComEA family DNA-binding protein n=2 Tax=Moraxellaceae TaxID=468 RepID=A0A2S2FG24_9GAMM|nr:ComEA family DNA-binding protein [Acinetobacter defluvii]